MAKYCSRDKQSSTEVTLAKLPRDGPSMTRSRQASTVAVGRLPLLQNNRSLMQTVVELPRAAGNAAVSGMLVQREFPDRRAAWGDLLNSFAAKFPAAAPLVTTSGAAMSLVKKAERAGVKFGGYAEDGPKGGAATKGAYTDRDTQMVYVPKKTTDPILAMRSFLYELNNAIRAPEYTQIKEDAVEGKLLPEQYAYQVVSHEIEAKLSVGEIGFEMTSAGHLPKDVYDEVFNLYSFKEFKAGRKSKDDLINAILTAVFPSSSGNLAGKTVKEVYMEDYYTARAKARAEDKAKATGGAK